MSKKFKQLLVPEGYRHYWSKYPEGYTILEALLNWVESVNQLTDNVNDWNIYLDDFVDTFDERLQPTVEMILTEMETDGRLADLINIDILNEINNKYTELDNDIDQINNQFYNVRFKGVDIGINDLSTELLGLLDNSNGGNFELSGTPKFNSVSTYSTSFLTEHKNLFNKNNIIFGKSLNPTTGAIQDSTTHIITENIPVIPNDQITQNYRMVIVFYDIEDNFIEGYQQIAPAENTPRTVNVPANAVYMRSSVVAGQIDVYQLERGSNSTIYEPFRVSFNTQMDISGETIEDNTVSVNKVDFLKRSTNLFNKNNIVRGESLNAIDIEIDNPPFSYTNYESINADKITFQYVLRINFYNENNTFITSIIPPSPAEPTTIDVPDEAVRFRSVTENRHLDRAQINIGSDILEYEDYYLDLIYSRQGNSGTSQRIKTHAKTLDKVYSAPLKQSMNAPDSELRTVDVNGFYAKYDALVSAYPSYVSRTLIHNDVDGNPIYRYDFKPEEVPETDNKLMKFFINTGTHGGERASMWTAFNMFDDICQRWKEDDVLEVLRWNVHFVIIPLVNPYSFIAKQNDTELGRHNKNGVDIPRNFPRVWESLEGTPSAQPGSNTYRGIESNSELETQAVYEVYQEGGWDFITDYHNFFSNPNQNYFTWIGGADNYMINLGQVFTRRMSNKWKRIRDYLPQDDATALGWTNLQNTGIYMVGQLDGIPSSLTEICNRIMVEPNTPQYSEDTMTLGTEFITNLMYMVYVNLVE